MLVIPLVQENREIYLDVYSNDETEFEKVGKVIEYAGIPLESSELEHPGKRKNRRFKISKGDRHKLEEYLKATFTKDVHRYLTEFDSEGKKYECWEITENGEKGDTDHYVDFLAKNEDVAALKAGLIANNNRWYDVNFKLME